MSLDNVKQQLAKLKPGYIPEEIFPEIARLVVLPSVVIIPFYRVKSQVKVLLTKRSSTDPHYPDMFHPPGTILRPTDASINEGINRLIDSELSGISFNTRPIFVDFVFERIDRGMELSLLYLIHLDELPGTYSLFKLDRLPLNIIQTDLHRISKAAEFFNGL